jgi:hypothetical protein
LLRLVLCCCVVVLVANTLWTKQQRVKIWITNN